MTSLKILAILTVTSLIAACGGGGGGGSSSDNGSNDPTVVTGLSSIVGVYEWFDEYPDGVVDEWYIAIDAQGYVSDYDYQGDSYDNFANCYYIDRNWDRFIHISENRFSTDDGSEVSIDIQQGGLLITPLDGSYDPEYIGPKVDIDVSTFETAECDSSNGLTSLSSDNSEENHSVSKFLNRAKKTP